MCNKSNRIGEQHIVRICLTLLSSSTKCFLLSYRKYQVPDISGTSSNPPKCQTLMTEVIKSSDPRAEKFTEAKKKEIQGLIHRRTWKIVLKKEVPVDADDLGGRFVLAINDEGTKNEVRKARFCGPGLLG